MSKTNIDSLKLVVQFSLNPSFHFTKTFIPHKLAIPIPYNNLSASSKNPLLETQNTFTGKKF